MNSLSVILDKANAKGIPVFGSEVEQVKLGCAAAANNKSDVPVTAKPAPFSSVARPAATGSEIAV